MRGDAMRAKVKRAVVGAARRLAQPSCAGLLDEFTDAAGQNLRGNLESTGVPAPDYLRQVLFYDGLDEGRCAAASVLAATAPGAQVVFVCARFYFDTFGRPDLAEAIVIHEALHTLGLGENPPSSGEITARVRSRCMQ
jgi:hypothetical protein